LASVLAPGNHGAGRPVTAGTWDLLDLQRLMPVTGLVLPLTVGLTLVPAPPSAGLVPTILRTLQATTGTAVVPAAPVPHGAWYRPGLGRWPAAAVQVAAIDSLDAVPTTTPRGHWITLLAPGVQLGTTRAAHDSAFGLVSGDGVAAAITAGALALVRHRAPAASAQAAAGELTATASPLPIILPAPTGSGAARTQPARRLWIPRPPGTP
jgi:hypothetical protein